LFDRTTVERYRRVIGYHAAEARRNAKEYSFEELHAMAMEVAADRYELWDAGMFPPGRDLAIHLARAIRADRYAKGWRQRTDKETGKRVWVRDELARTGADFELLSDPRRQWEPEGALFGEDDDEGETYSLMADWPAFTPGERRQFARYMEVRYPEVCAAFEALDQEAKPPAMQWARWKRNRELTRARLQVVHARELAEVRFAVTYGGLGQAA
jgi:hypothetical protein